MLELKDAMNAYHKSLRKKYQKGIDANSFYVEEVISKIVDEDLDSWAYFGKFKNYFENHQDEFNSEQKALILLMANKIGSSFAKQNKSELVLIARTNLLFDTD